MSALLQTRSANRARRVSRAVLRREMRAHRWHYVFLTPMVVLALMFTVWPIVASWVISFFRWDGFGPLDEFVGFDLFVEAVGSPLFWNAFGNTFWFTAVAVVIEMPLALFFALLLNNVRLRGRNIYRVLIFIPVVTTTAVVGVVFAVLLSANGGAVNVLLEAVHIVDGPINFLGSETIALPTVLGVNLWKNVGVTMIYFLAALQTVPQDVYDAAAVDGASRWRTLRHITVPMILPIGMVILLLTVITSFDAFDLVQTMTGGGPNHSTDIIPTYIYRYAFNPEQFLPRYGFASAAALFFGVAVLILTLFVLLSTRWLQRRREGGSR